MVCPSVLACCEIYTIDAYNLVLHTATFRSVTVTSCSCVTVTVTVSVTATVYVNYNYN